MIESEIPYIKATVQHFSHYTKGIPPQTGGSTNKKFVDNAIDLTLRR